MSCDQFIKIKDSYAGYAFLLVKLNRSSKNIFLQKLLLETHLYSNQLGIFRKILNACSREKTFASVRYAQNNVHNPFDYKYVIVFESENTKPSLLEFLY